MVRKIIELKGQSFDMDGKGGSTSNNSMVFEEILITGHSLGAGVSVLLAMLWRALPPGVFSPTNPYNSSSSSKPINIKCIAFAPPQILDYNAAKRCESFTTSVIMGNDIVPRLGLKSALRLCRRVKVMLDEEAREARDAEEAAAKAAGNSSSTDYLNVAKTASTTVANDDVLGDYAKSENNPETVAAEKAFGEKPIADAEIVVSTTPGTAANLQNLTTLATETPAVVTGETAEPESDDTDATIDQIPGLFPPGILIHLPLEENRRMTKATPKRQTVSGDILSSGGIIVNQEEFQDIVVSSRMLGHHQWPKILEGVEHEARCVELEKTRGDYVVRAGA